MTYITLPKAERCSPTNLIDSVNALDYSSDMDDPSADETEDSAENYESRKSHSHGTPDKNLEIVLGSDCALKSDRSIKKSWEVLAIKKAETFSETNQKLPSLSEASTTKFGGV